MWRTYVVEEETSLRVCVLKINLVPRSQLCDRSAIRLAQAEYLVARMEAFLRQRFGDDFLSVPVVLAGDLNNVPGVDVYT